MEQHNCKNCGNLFEVNFCNVCGQKITHRLDLKHILHEAAHVFTHADKGIFAFIPKVLTKPGIIALDYVEGKRKAYFNPIQYLVIIVGIVTFLMSKTDLMEQTVASVNKMSNPNMSPKVLAVQRDLTQFIQKYFNLVMLLLIPVYSFYCWLLFRKKSGYNYAENLVAIILLQAQINTISILVSYPLLIIFKAKDPTVTLIIPMAIMLFCFVVTFTQFFKVSKWEAIWKGDTYSIIHQPNPGRYNNFNSDGLRTIYKTLITHFIQFHFPLKCPEDKRSV